MKPTRFVIYIHKKQLIDFIRNIWWEAKTNLLTITICVVDFHSKFWYIFYNIGTWA